MDPYQFVLDSDSDTEFEGFSTRDIHNRDDTLVNDQNDLSDISSISSTDSSDYDMSSDESEYEEPPDFKENPPNWRDHNLKHFKAPAANLQDGPKLPPGWDSCSEPIDYFKLFLTEQIIDKIVEYTNSYAAIAIRKKQTCFPRFVDKHWNIDGTNNVDVNELLAYLSCCVVLLINPSHQLRHAFSSDPFLCNQGLRSIFTLKRFQKISQYFCLCDKMMEPPRNSPLYEKGYKVKTDHLNTTFCQYFKFSGFVCLDESMQACRSHLSEIQFNPSKPIKRGLKIFSLCDSKTSDSCYLLKFEPYFGKRHTKVSKHWLYFDVVNRLTELIRGHNVKLFCDNLYTSLPLFCFLKRNYNIRSTGTIRSSKIGLPPAVKNPGKMVRGGFKMFQDANDESLTACVWQDTCQVRYISTAYFPTVVGAALRRVNARYKRINQPLLCSEYCCHYQNVDRFDQVKSQYLISRRSYRSWKYLWFLGGLSLHSNHLIG